MADRPVRKKQPFLFWLPARRIPSQATKKPKPPSIPSQLPPASSPSSPQLEGDRTQLMKVPSPSSSGRREVLPQDEPPRPQVDSKELADELGKSDAQFTLTSSPEKEITQTKFESKKVAETETSGVEPTIDELAEEIRRPGIEMEPQKDSEAQLEKIQEEKTELAETKQITEEFQSEGVETAEEEVSEEPEKVSEPKISIKVSDVMSPGRITEEETPEESTNGALKESKRHNSTMKERKITISTMPHTSSQNLGQSIMNKELKDGLSRLVPKLRIGHENKLGNEQGVNIITLASENHGAFMFIGKEIHPGKKFGKSNETREENYHNVKGNQSIVASINSNVQGINSSILEETNYSEKNPGVHMTISTKPTVPVSVVGKTESQKATSIITSPQKLTYEPNIRRRCLRSLFLESSEDDDIKNPQKPRRHGCRFTCDDKMKGKLEDTGSSRKT